MLLLLPSSTATSHCVCMCILLTVVPACRHIFAGRFYLLLCTSLYSSIPFSSCIFFSFCFLYPPSYRLVCICVFAALLCFGLEPKVQVEKGGGVGTARYILIRKGRINCSQTLFRGPSQRHSLLPKGVALRTTERRQPIYYFPPSAVWAWLLPHFLLI